MEPYVSAASANVPGNAWADSPRMLDRVAVMRVYGRYAAEVRAGGAVPGPALLAFPNNRLLLGALRRCTGVQRGSLAALRGHPAVWPDDPSVISKLTAHRSRHPYLHAVPIYADSTEARFRRSCWHRN